jgi:uncharacterized membrane protein YbhN (UPF0104 family)
VDRRRRLVTALRVVASIVMLAVLVPRVHLSSLLPDWNTKTFFWLAAGLGVTLAGIVLSTLRWQQVLLALGLPAPTGALLSHYMAGLFVGNFLPSTIGGDVLRVSRLSASNGESPATFASVVIERLTGWLVLPVIALVGLVANPHLLELRRPSVVALVVSGGTLVLLVVLLWMAAHPNLGGRLAQHESWLRFVGAVHLGIDRFRRQPAAIAGVLAVGFAYQLAVVLAACLASEALGLDLGWGVLLAFIPVVAMLQVLPISIGGLGVREGALYLFLHPLGVTAGQAVALGLLVYGMQLAVSLLGAPAFAIGGRPARARATA